MRFNHRMREPYPKVSERKTGVNRVPGRTIGYRSIREPSDLDASGYAIIRQMSTQNV